MPNLKNKEVTSKVVIKAPPNKKISMRTEQVNKRSARNKIVTINAQGLMLSFNPDEINGKKSNEANEIVTFFPLVYFY